jgi:hypothetical protein
MPASFCGKVKGDTIVPYTKYGHKTVKIILLQNSLAHTLPTASIALE